MGSLLDTILNLGAFGATGLCIWLYLRPAAIDREDSDEDADGAATAPKDDTPGS